jgi:hypothetical protein
VPVGDVQGEGFSEGVREGHDAIFAALAVGDPDAGGVQVDVVEADGDEFGAPDSGVEQGLDQHYVAAAPGLARRPGSSRGLPGALLACRYLAG